MLLLVSDRVCINNFLFAHLNLLRRVLVRDLVRGFLPSYGACVMGTGVVAVVLNAYWHEAAVAFTYLNTAIAAVVVSLLLAKVALFPGIVWRELEDPVLSNFYPTAPIGLMVLASDYSAVLGLDWAAFPLWFVGAVLTFALGVVVPFNLFRSESVKMDHINPSVFIPPVGLIVIPVMGGHFMASMQGPAYDLMATFNLASWGSGFFIYLALLAVCVNRFLLHHPLPSTLAPTMWINLGPIGAGTLSLWSLMNSLTAINECMRYSLTAFLLLYWGSGLWWLTLAIVMTAHYATRKGLPYAPSWWAFVFPLGAYTAATALIAKEAGLATIAYIHHAETALLLALWAAAFTGNMQRAIKTVTNKTG